MNETLYPPSVKGVPPDFTKPNVRYRMQVVIVLISLFLFLCFYFGMISGCGWVIWKTIQIISESAGGVSKKDDATGLWLTASLVAIVIMLFLVKGLFKRQEKEKDLQIEVTEREHSELFGFIRHICAETKAPFPYRVFLTHDVNAAVFYNSSLLSLFMPVRKNLLIGLGLVNGLNLSEFKAVLAHEFGHFSQSSMRLGSYVYMANKIIADIVFHRDVFDDILKKWCRAYYRIAIFGWVIFGVLWVLRKILEGVFYAINFVGRALSRQMEFHADLVAVSLTGSDAIAHGLHKSDFINDCLQQAFADLKDASEHKLYSHDIFFHQTLAANYLRQIRREPKLGTLPPLPENASEKTQLFNKEEENDSEGMWASHPSNFEREQCAKKIYIRSEEDTRSPWLLFHNSDSIRFRMSEKFYQFYLDLPATTNFASPEEVQKFIDEEHAETTQDPRYEGLYDGRFILIPENQLTSYANDPSLPSISTDQIQALLNKLYHAEYKEWYEGHQKRSEEEDMLEVLASGEVKTKEKTFEFRGKRYPNRDAKMLIERVRMELEPDKEWLTAFDREVFLIHLRMAQLVGAGDQDLYLRYYFHLKLQETLKKPRLLEMNLVTVFQYLTNNQGEISAEDYVEVVKRLNEIYRGASQAITQANSIGLPALQNLTEGVSLGAYLLPEPLIPPLYENGKSIDVQWMMALGSQLSEINGRCNRLFFKSMGSILSKQEAITKSWQESQSSSSLDSHLVEPGSNQVSPLLNPSS